MILARRLMFGIAVLLLVSLVGRDPLSVSASASPGMAAVLVQADVDTDLDGLTDVREAELGTDPALADTDGDGLLDGEEVDEFGTDPFTFDSDEDGFPDPLEIDAGTDPLDAGSTPLDPDANRTLDVTIFACPPGTVNANPSDCETVAGVAVDIARVGFDPLATQTTDANGLASFNGLAADTYVITEDVPGDALEDIQVRCGYGGGESFPVEPSGNGITLDIGQGGTFACSFFNIAADLATNEGELTVEALVCPIDYDDGDFFTVCDEPAEGVLVTVTAADGSGTADGETDAAGLVSFAELTGEYTVELGVPGDFARFKVFCGAVGAPEYLTLEDSESNVITLDVGTETSIGCTFFIIPEDSGAPTATAEPGTTPTVVAPTAAATRPAGGVSDLPNTGAGPGATAESTLLLMIIALIGGVAITLIALRRAGRP